MAQAKKQTTSRKPARRATRARAARTPDVIVLSPEDRDALRARYDIVQQHRAVEQMLQESYQGCLNGLRERYDLPEFFNIDWSNGVVTEVVPGQPEQAATA